MLCAQGKKQPPDEELDFWKTCSGRGKARFFGLGLERLCVIHTGLVLQYTFILQVYLLVECKCIKCHTHCMLTKEKPQSAPGTRRFPCPVACALDILGDRWTLLVIRDLMMGRSRFKDFIASAERIPTNILSDRLARLVNHRIVKQIPVEESPGRLAYKLTKKGKSLTPILLALKDWGLQWEKGTRASLEDS